MSSCGIFDDNSWWYYLQIIYLASHVLININNIYIHKCKRDLRYRALMKFHKCQNSPGASSHDVQLLRLRWNQPPQHPSSADPTSKHNTCKRDSYTYTRRIQMNTLVSERKEINLRYKIKKSIVDDVSYRHFGNILATCAEHV